MKTPKIKNTSPSLGRIQRQRGKVVHCSTRYVPAKVEDNGDIIEPAHYDFRKGVGITYRKPKQ